MGRKGEREKAARSSAHISCRGLRGRDAPSYTPPPLYWGERPVSAKAVRFAEILDSDYSGRDGRNAISHLGPLLGPPNPPPSHPLTHDPTLKFPRASKAPVVHRLPAAAACRGMVDRDDADGWFWADSTPDKAPAPVPSAANSGAANSSAQPAFKPIVAPPSADGQLQFQFDGTPWRDVIQWLADDAKLALHMSETPTGSFTYSDPRTYTHDEAIARINLFLLGQGYTIVRSGKLMSVINLENPRSMQPARRPCPTDQRQ